MVKIKQRPLNFQKNIQGIRALGIIGVLLFHAGYNFAKGGYLSVDIFFVISGFFMFIIIMNIKEHENFFITFYKRRITRILPLSVFVITILTVASIKYFPTLFDPDSIKSSLFFYSNFHFHNNSNYFLSFNDNIFLHFWSLSLEEQFYLIFPLFIFFLRKYFFNYILIIFISIISLNLIAIHFLGNLSSSYPFIDKELSFYKPLEVFSFFLLTSRFWEFCLGGVAGILYLNETFGNNKINLKIANLISFLGFLMIIFSQTIFDKSIPHPSIYTLIPCLGVFLIIVFSFKGTFTYIFFSNPILVFIGNISFSLYLWHAPILIFNDYLNLKNINTDISKAIAIFLSIVLSYLTYKLVENFFRKKDHTLKAYIFILFNVLFIIFIFFAVHFKKTIPFLLNEDFYLFKSINEKPRSLQKLPCKFYNVKPINAYEGLCYFGDTSEISNINKKNLYIFTGFSNALMLLEASDTLLVKKQAMGLWYNRKYECEKLNPLMPNIWGINKNHQVNNEKIENCEKLNKKLKTFIKENFKDYNITIIYSNDWDARLFGDGIDTFFKTQNFNNEGLMTDKNITIDNFKLYLDNFNFPNAKHIFINQIPTYEISPLSVFENHLKSTGDYSPYQLFAEPRNISNFLKQDIRSILNNKGFVIINPFDVFCDKDSPKNCLIFQDGEFLYFDKEHLSTAGANILMKQVLNNY
tara:strand:- start:262 stop:2343 length:2082 start_codon:yes stop_codon:yes gene_type:complete